MPSLSINELESITDTENLEFFVPGDSLKKYTGLYKGEKIILRLFPRNDFYKNRYFREGDSLRALAKTLDAFNSPNHNCSLVIPKIIEEWPNATNSYSIRALEWIEGKSLEKTGYKIEPKVLDIFWASLQEAGKKMPKDFSFQHDILAYLFQPAPVSQSQTSSWQLFRKLTSKLMESVNLTFRDEVSLIHGDFHYGNIVRVKSNQRNQIPTYAIIDWEFATRGNLYFDLAYLHVFSDWQPPANLKLHIQKWIALAIAVITHWYILNDPASNLTQIWLRKLQKNLKMSI
ncbi:MAG: phosphotransferase family protein [Candidatus Hodarchaeota archaeon]